jgi:hypothetical protein
MASTVTIVRRRRARIRSDLAALAEAVETMTGPGESSAETGGLAASIVRTLRLFFLPRLADPPAPLVVALVGSTGVGKSTLLNSIAHASVARPGVLRPTTDRPTAWAGEEHRAALTWATEAMGGRFVAGEHPLASHVALIDTPDLDSHVLEHRRIALDVLAGADAAVFVTTAARYADAGPWHLLSQFGERPLAVVLNRVPSRSSGARTDLIARLRQAGLAETTVLTITEQRVDPHQGSLGSPTVQRLAALLARWAAQAEPRRLALLDIATDRMVADLGKLLRMAEEEAEVSLRLAKLVQASYQRALDRIEGLLTRSPVRSRWFWRPNRRLTEMLHGRVLVAVDEAAREAAGHLERAGISIAAELLRADPATVDSLSVIGRGRHPPSHLREILERDAARFSRDEEAPAAEVLEMIRHQIDLLTGLDWSHV